MKSYLALLEVRGRLVFELLPVIRHYPKRPLPDDLAARSVDEIQAWFIPETRFASRLRRFEDRNDPDWIAAIDRITDPDPQDVAQGALKKLAEFDRTQLSFVQDNVRDRLPPSRSQSEVDSAIGDLVTFPLSRRILSGVQRMRESPALALAIQEASARIKRDATDSRAYDARGFAYYQQGKLKDAIADLDRAIATDSKLASAYLHRGLALARIDRNRAIQDLEVALELDSTVGNSCVSAASSVRAAIDAHLEKSTELVRNAAVAWQGSRSLDTVDRTAVFREDGHYIEWDSYGLANYEASQAAAHADWTGFNFGALDQIEAAQEIAEQKAPEDGQCLLRILRARSSYWAGVRSGRDNSP